MLILSPEDCGSVSDVILQPMDETPILLSELRKSELYLDRGEYYAALKLARKLEDKYASEARNEDSIFWDIVSVVGLANYHLEDYQSALGRFEQILEKWPDAPNTLFMKAKCHDYLDDLKSAEEAYKRVLQLDPNAPCAHCFLGLVLESQSRVDEALNMYREALRVDPNDAESRGRLLELLQTNEY